MKNCDQSLKKNDNHHEKNDLNRKKERNEGEGMIIGI